MLFSSADIRRIADTYLAMRGMAKLPAALPYARVNTHQARDIAAAYDRLPIGPDDESRNAYSFLTYEIGQQFAALVAAGVRFTPHGDEGGYASSAAMMADLQDNAHLHVYAGGADHPAMTRHQTWQFRAVHDVFGHALHGYQFGPRGEENAYRAHRLMFTRPAVAALTNETRGQNSWVNFGPFADRPARQRPYAEQKARLLPAWCMED